MGSDLLTVFIIALVAVSLLGLPVAIAALASNCRGYCKIVAVFALLIEGGWVVLIKKTGLGLPDLVSNVPWVVFFIIAWTMIMIVAMARWVEDSPRRRRTIH
ncbi:MAG: hypothetical protein HYS83_00765 [Candidatus Blackburnbacteria bacterium]|nr:hypothetical protein [Candidatus Blackburnbacteria bacterium]